MDRTETVEALPNGNAVQEYSDVDREGGEDLTIRYWMVCNLVPPSHHRLAIFYFTDLKSGFASPETRRLVATPRQESVQAEFSAKLGR